MNIHAMTILPGNRFLENIRNGRQNAPETKKAAVDLKIHHYFW